MPQNRTKTGTFAPGTSGNPGGRPKRTDAQKAAQENDAFAAKFGLGRAFGLDDD